ncbi:MAG: helix-turn-helix domain-containing protein [Gemmatimonas sp.]|jgi:transcriptional regulator with XRE-family HTH domain|uniref:helix-turn-helix domain-containing protein n=1 Tax=Gemmatimonas sp. TaxID=1962908 RepID=UPI00391FA717
MDRKLSTTRKKLPRPAPFKRTAVTERIDWVFRELYGSRGFTLSDIARELGVDKSLPGKWIKKGPRGSTPSGEQLARMAVAFDVSVDWLLTGHGPASRSGMVQRDELEGMIEERLTIALREAGRRTYPITGAALIQRLTATVIAEASEREAWGNQQTLVTVVGMVRDQLLRRAHEFELNQADVYIASRVVGEMVETSIPAPASLILDPL